VVAALVVLVVLAHQVREVLVEAVQALGLTMVAVAVVALLL
jgi:hypothetical protein